jgi:hypothetical protein
VILADDLQHFAHGDRPALVTQSEPTELRKSFERFHADGLSTLRQFESGDGHLVLLDETRMLLCSLACLPVDQGDQLLQLHFDGRRVNVQHSGVAWTDDGLVFNDGDLKRSSASDVTRVYVRRALT